MKKFSKNLLQFIKIFKTSRLLIIVSNLKIFNIKCLKFLIALLMSKIPIAEMSCQTYVVIYSINSLSVYPINFRYIFSVSNILKYPLMYFRVPANFANPIVMYFRVLKYTNNDTRYTKVSCIVYKSLV